MNTNNENGQPAVQSIEILQSVEPLVRLSDAWIVDVWGVIHNGVSAFEEACAACAQYRQRGGTVILVSNAPRPWSGVAKQLAAMSIKDDIYDAIVTSGDVTRDLIAANAGRPLYHLGPPRDVPVFDGLDVNFAAAEDAQIVVLTGLFNDDSETPDDYTELLGALHARNVPMICANPDIQVEKGDEVVYCAGALAQAYEALGGAVDYAGKPYPPIYDLAMRKMSEGRRDPITVNRILCIGDGIHTDIKGAAVMGMKSLFIPSRVNMSSATGVDEDEIKKAFAALDYAPDAAMVGLRW